MKTPVLDRLREVLASMSHEEFLAQWAEIEQGGNNGPTAKELITSFSKPALGRPSCFTCNVPESASFQATYNFYMAA